MARKSALQKIEAHEKLCRIMQRQTFDQIKELIALPGDTDVILKINNNKVSHQYKLNKKEKLIKK